MEGVEIWHTHEHTCEVGNKGVCKAGALSFVSVCVAVESMCRGSE